MAKARPERVADVMDRAAPTCRPAESVAEVLSRFEGSGAGGCVVINQHGVVFGRLWLDRLDPADARLAEDVMELGPVTIRADADLAETTERMRQRRVSSLIVTTPEGVLLGVMSADGKDR